MDVRRDMAARRPFDRLAGRFAGERRQIIACLLIAAAVVAPFTVRLSERALDLSPEHLWLWIVIGALALSSRLLFGVACLLMLLTAFVLQHIGRHWGKGQVDARFEAFYESPASEIREYLQSHVDAFDGLSLTGIAVIVLLMAIVLRRDARTTRTRLAGAAVFALALGFAAWSPGIGVASVPPLALAQEAAAAKIRLNQLSGREAYLASRPLEPRVCRTTYDKIVIVLGESAVSDHMSVFGYGKPTTPFASRSGAHAFDALSPSNQTRISLAFMLTEVAPDTYDSFYRSRSLVSELRACGYRTTWISNQGRRGKDDDIASSIAAEADEQIFLNEGSWKAVRLDGAIVEELAARRVFGRSRQATFVHLIGSHFKYGERFPEGFGLSEASDTVSKYDNSILYTDHVLSELYRGFSGDGSLIVYASDHGQVVSNGRFGAGFSPGYQEEFRAPLLIWTADTGAIDVLRGEIGESRVNLESFDDIVRYLTGMTPALRLSKRPTVSVLTPGNLKDYRELASFAEE